MSSPAEVLYRVMVDLGLGSGGVGSEDWPIFIGFMPEAPDEALCVYDTAGRQDGRIMSNGEQIIHPGIQIRIRGKVYSTTRAKAENIARILSEQKRRLVEPETGVFKTLMNFSQTGDILSLGIEAEDPRRRHHFTINAIATITQPMSVPLGIDEVLRGLGPPTDPPPGDVAIYFDQSPGATTVLYWWNGSAWIPFG